MFFPYTPPSFSSSRTVLHHTEEHHLLELFFDRLEQGVFVDVGGNIPSNAVSKPFHDRGWTGVLKEPIPDNAALFRASGWAKVEEVAVTNPEKSSAGSQELFLAGGNHNPHSSLEINQIDPNSLHTQDTIVVKLETLQHICAKHESKQIHLLSIGTEGVELDVLKGIDFETIQVDLILGEDWQRDSSIDRYLVTQGFQIILRTGFNSGYIPNTIKIDMSLVGRLKILKKIYISSHIKRLRH